MNQRIFPIEHAAMERRLPWWPRERAETIKDQIAQAVSEVETKLQEFLLRKGFQATSEVTINILVVGEVDAVSGEAGLPEGTKIGSALRHVAVDFSLRDGKISVYDHDD